MIRAALRKLLPVFLLLFCTFFCVLNVSSHTELDAIHVGDSLEFQELPQDGWIQADKVVLEGLDKITARVFTADVYINQLVRFGTLELYVRAAYKSPPEETPESACFLEIFDCKPREKREKVFSGWMFASNPVLSALEHAVYDVWIKEAIIPAELEEGV